MAKGNRKRAKKVVPTTPREKAISKIKRDDCLPLATSEAYLIKEVVDRSQVFGKLMNQWQQQEFLLQDLIWKRKQIQKGKILINKDNPILLPFAGNSFYYQTDKKQVLSDLDKQIEILKNQNNGINGQLTHNRDEFIESGLRLKNFMEGRFGSYTSKGVGVQHMTTGKRVSAGKSKQQNTEKVLFEEEFQELMKDAEKQNKYREAVKKAKDENKKQKA